MKGPIKCIVVDDEPLAVELLSDYVVKTPQLKLIGTGWNAMQAMELLRKYPIDLMFLDIQMPVLDGVELVKSLINPPKVVFTTAYRDYAVESYELQVVDYLLKPITFPRFLKAVNRYGKLVQERDGVTPQKPKLGLSDYIYVNTNRKKVKVVFDDILYVESMKDYVRIYTDGDSITTKDKISEFIAKLPSQFLRVHRSYIVNRDKVTAFTNQDVFIDKIEIPLGISYKKVVLEDLDG